MKLHLCCGTVYLNGYLNVDIHGYLKKEAAEIGLKGESTTFDQYYTKPLSRTPLEQRGQFIVDQRVDLLQEWPWGDESASKIVMIQSLEHFLPEECLFLLREINRVLKPGGAFIFDFPDVVRTVLDYYEQDFEQMIRLLYCNHKDKYSIHKIGFNKRMFRHMLMTTGSWAEIEFKKVVEHDYPVIGGIAINNGQTSSL